jgi:hypothetical protein
MKYAVSLAALAGSLFVAAPANAAVVMLQGFNSNAEISTFLTANGHTVVPTSSNYTGVDVVVLLRADGDANLLNWVTGGGNLLTEWSGADWALNTANLLNADVTGGGFIGTNTTVSFTPEGLAAGLGTGVGSSYSAAHASEFARSIANVGAGTSVWATIPGNAPVVVAGFAGSGFVIANGLDWADSFATSGSANQQVLLNYINAFSSGAQPVPEPGTWAMMLLGFGAVGFAMRRRKPTAAGVSQIA